MTIDELLQPGRTSEYQRIQDALSMLKTQTPEHYNYAGDIPLQIQYGSGPNYAETMPVDESMNPNPGFNTIELRPKSKSFNPFELGNMLSGELLHIRGGHGADPDSNYMKLKDKFIDSFTPRQIEFEKKKLKRFQDEGATGSNFENFDNYMQNVASDAYIGGGLFPDRNAEYIKQGMYSEKQGDILRDMWRLLSGDENQGLTNTLPPRPAYLRQNRMVR